jgi:hypothetical protein
MIFTDAGDFPPAQRMALLHVLHGRGSAEPSTGVNGGSRAAANSDEPVAR